MCKLNEMMNYFKGEKEFYEFALICTDGKNRMDILKADIRCYSSKKHAKAWYDNIISKIEDERAIEKLNEMFMLMAK